MSNVGTTSETVDKNYDPRARNFLIGSVGSFASYGISALLAGASTVLAVSVGSTSLFLTIVLLVLAWDTFRLWAKRSRLGHRAVLRALLAVAVGIAFANAASGAAAVTAAAVAGALIAGPIFFESLLAKGTNSKETFVANLPGVRTYGPLKGLDRPTLTLSEAVIACGAILAFTGAPPAFWLSLAIVVDIVYLAIAVAAYMRIRKNSLAKSRVSDAVAAYEPEFYVYTSRPDDASYQILMWLPFLARTGKKFAVVTRNNVPAKALAEQIDSPIITCPKSADLENILVPSLGAVFYVNASSGNGEMIRHQEYMHVYLGHGDSDKPPSYNPTHAMYDRIFAAGQAATERYAAHGVTIAPDKFEIVGRPQLEAVDVTAELPETGGTTVLYAPTWRGHVDETMLHSLPTAPALIQELLARNVTVIFRPHPFSYEFEEDAETILEIQTVLSEHRKQTGRMHVFGPAAESDLDVIECMNLSDAMISDVSSVVSDYLYSGKPFAMTAVSSHGDQFIEDYPIARASYVLNGDLSNVQEVLDAILLNDPMRHVRLQYRSFYLGDFSDEDYAENFVSAAARMISNSENQYVGNDESADEEGTSAFDEDGPQAEAPAANGSVENSDEETEADDLSDTKSAWGTLSLIYRKLGGRTLLPAGFAALAYVLTVVDILPMLTGMVGAVGSLAFLFVHRHRFKSRSRLAGILRAANASRAVLVVTMAVFWHLTKGGSWMVAAAAMILVFTIVMESSLAKSWKVTGLEARNLPDAETRGYQPIGRGYVAVAGTVVTTIGWLLAMLGSAGIVLLVLSFVPLILGLVLLIAGLERGVRSIRLDGRLYGILDDYGAEFVLYFGSNVGITYQLGMWLPYLEQIDKKFIVVTRTLKMMRAAGQITEAPVINRPTLRSLEEVITPSVGAAFYVNNAGKNTHFIERREMVHVWLNHGDSEKPACFNPVHAIYDYIFAAGQAGVDRYARHGVEIPGEKFKIVGRPQVDQIVRTMQPINAISDKTVLYAPTWRGAYDDSALYSLPIGDQIVRELLRRGCRVIFRAHPLNYRFAIARHYIDEIQATLEEDAKLSGREHLWGATAEKEMSAEECFNASDAMISDVSAVVSDYLQSSKPLSIVSVGRTREELLDEVPAAKASYVLNADLSNLTEVLEELVVNDSMRASRDAMRVYYLGDFASESYSETFLQTSRQMISRGKALEGE